MTKTIEIVSEISAKKLKNKSTIFETIGKPFASVGIYPAKPAEDFHRFTLINSLILAFSILAAISMAMFACCEAQTLSEYSQSIYACVTSFLGVVFTFATIGKTEHIFHLMACFDRTIQKRKLNEKNVMWHLS